MDTKASTKEIQEEPKTIADAIPFTYIAQLLEKITKKKSSKEKIPKVEQCFSNFRKEFLSKYKTLDSYLANNDSLFCIVRILLPTEDKTREAYGFKDKKLATILAKAIGLSPETRDGKKLFQFKTGDLGQVFHDILKERSSNITQNISLGQLHQILDDLASQPQDRERLMDKQQKILQSLIRRLSPLEAKWVIKILLKHDMKAVLGLSEPQIFNCLHPQANDLYKTVSTLEVLCLKLNDNTAKVDTTAVHLFQPFKPMRCVRLNVIDDAGSNPNAKDRVTYLPPGPFFVEYKWNGERTLVHFDKSKPFQDQFRYFTRNSFDVTFEYSITLTPKLRLLIKDCTCTSFILDGEMMAFHRKSGKYTQKTNNIDVKKLGKGGTEDPEHCPVFVIYDLVYFNNESLVTVPLVKRIEILHLVVEEKQDVIVFSRQRVMSSKAQVQEALNEAISNLEEGLVIKERDSLYRVGCRDPAWLKIKPEYYIENSITDLDVLILGAYYAKSNSRSGTINHFLFGLLDPEKEEFFPLGTVGSGRLKLDELEKFVKEELDGKLVRTLDPSFKINFKGTKKPDFYIDPKQSIVLQIRATEIVNNDSLFIKYTLVNPVLEKIRLDKSWEDILTVQEFDELRIHSGGKLASRTDNAPKSMISSSSTASNQSKINSSPLATTPKPLPRTSSSTSFKFRKRNTPSSSTIVAKTETLHPHSPREKHASIKHFAINKNYKSQYSKSKRASNREGVDKKATEYKSPLYGRIIHVVGSPEWKKNIEQEILEYGGQIVQNPTKDTFAIIAEKLSFKTNLLIKKGIYNILKYSWFQDAIATGDFSIENAAKADVWSVCSHNSDNRVLVENKNTPISNESSTNSLLPSSKFTHCPIAPRDIDDIGGIEETLGKIPSSEDESTGYDSDTDVEDQKEGRPDADNGSSENKNKKNKSDSFNSGTDTGSDTDYENNSHCNAKQENNDSQKENVINTGSIKKGCDSNNENLDSDTDFEDSDGDSFERSLSKSPILHRSLTSDYDKDEDRLSLSPILKRSYIAHDEKSNSTDDEQIRAQKVPKNSFF